MAMKRERNQKRQALQQNTALRMLAEPDPERRHRLEVVQVLMLAITSSANVFNVKQQNYCFTFSIIL